MYHGGNAGRKQSKKGLQLTKFKELYLWSAKVIAEVARRRVELLEEKSTLAVFSIQPDETEQGKRDRRDLLSLTRAEHLRNLLERNKKPTFLSVATTPPIPTANDEKNATSNTSVDCSTSASANEATVVPIPMPPMPPILPIPLMPPIPHRITSIQQTADDSQLMKLHAGATQVCFGNSQVE